MNTTEVEDERIRAHELRIANAQTVLNGSQATQREKQRSHELALQAKVRAHAVRQKRREDVQDLAVVAHVKAKDFVPASLYT